MHTYILRVWINGIQPQESRYRVSGIAVPENWNGGAIWAGFFSPLAVHQIQSILEVEFLVFITDAHIYFVCLIRVHLGTGLNVH